MAPSASASAATHAAALAAGVALGAGALWAAQRIVARRAAIACAAASPRTPGSAVSRDEWSTPLAAAEERLNAAERAAAVATDAARALGRRINAAVAPPATKCRPAPISLAAVATAAPVGGGTSPWAVEGCPPPLPTPPAEGGGVLRSPTKRG